MVSIEKCDIFSFRVVALQTSIGKHTKEILYWWQFIEQSIWTIPPTAKNGSFTRWSSCCQLAIVAFECLNPNPDSQPTAKYVSHCFVT